MWKFLEEVRFFANGKQGGWGFNPTNWHPIKRELLKNVRISTGWETPAQTPPPPVISWGHTTKHLFLFLWVLWRMWSNCLHGNNQGVWDLEVWTQKLYRGRF